MNEAQIRFRAVRWLYNKYQFVAPNLRYMGSQCDFLCISHGSGLVEIEHKKNILGIKDDFRKKCEDKQGNTKRKHDIIKIGERCDFYYFLIPNDPEMIKLIPKNYGIIKYRVTKKGNVIFSTLRESKCLSKKPYQFLYNAITWAICGRANEYLLKELAKTTDGLYPDEKGFYEFQNKLRSEQFNEHYK